MSKVLVSMVMLLCLLLSDSALLVSVMQATQHSTRYAVLDNRTFDSWSDALYCVFIARCDD